ncbi:MAG: hypothetical protein PF574_07365 [Candidatus Delongbacteria bacterium]|jgi:hypothetical protein|nr:hypothetical protein [Candidatus Delongbacteria bacterium]
MKVSKKYIYNTVLVIIIMSTIIYGRYHDNSIHLQDNIISDLESNLEIKSHIVERLGIEKITSNSAHRGKYDIYLKYMNRIYE